MRKTRLKAFVYFLILGLSPYFAQTNTNSTAQLDGCERAVSKPIDAKLMQILQKLGLPPHSSIDDLRYDFFAFVEGDILNLPDNTEYDFLVFLEAIDIINDIHNHNNYPYDYSRSLNDFINAQAEERDSNPELSALALSRIWRSNPEARYTLSIFADKVQILRSRRPPNHLSSIKDDLIEAIFRVFIKINIYNSPINIAVPEPILAIIHSLDTLSHSEMFIISQWINRATVEYGHNPTNCLDWNTCFNFNYYKLEYEKRRKEYEEGIGNDEDREWNQRVDEIIKAEQEWRR